MFLRLLITTVSTLLTHYSRSTSITPTTNPDDVPYDDLQHVKKLSDQDEDIFQTVHLINCSWFGSAIFSDYFSNILGLVHQGTLWSLNLFGVCVVPTYVYDSSWLRALRKCVMWITSFLNVDMAMCVVLMKVPFNCPWLVTDSANLVQTLVLVACNYIAIWWEVGGPIDGSHFPQPICGGRRSWLVISIGIFTHHVLKSKGLKDAMCIIGFWWQLGLTQWGILLRQWSQE